MKLFITLVLLASTQAFLLKNKLEGEVNPIHNNVEHKHHSTEGKTEGKTEGNVDFKPCTKYDGKNMEVTKQYISHFKKHEKPHYIFEAKALKRLRTTGYLLSTYDRGKRISQVYSDWVNDVNYGKTISFDRHKDEITEDIPKDQLVQMQFMDKDKKLDCIEYAMKLANICSSIILPTILGFLIFSQD